MNIHTLMLTDFRNFSEASYTFDPQVTFIQGQNGTGKSAILEALYLLFYGRSFRIHQPKQLIREGAATCRIRLEGRSQELDPSAGLTRPDISVGLEKNLQGETRLRMNRETLTSHVPLAQQVAINLLHPEMTEELLTDRTARRQLIDWGLFYLNPEFFDRWKRFQRILKQRNALLKASLISPHSAQLTEQCWVWDEAFCVEGEWIHHARLAYCDQLFDRFQGIDPSFAEALALSIHYYPGWSKEYSLRDALLAHHAQDRALGYTVIGPHRADWVLKSSHVPIRSRLSRGQQKKVIWTLKLAQSLTVGESGRIASLILMDDLAAELDRAFQEKLWTFALSIPAQLICTGIHIPEYLPSMVPQIVLDA